MVGTDLEEVPDAFKQTGVVGAEDTTALIVTLEAPRVLLSAPAGPVDDTIADALGEAIGEGVALLERFPEEPAIAISRIPAR